MRLFALAPVLLACSLFTPFVRAYVIKIWRDSAYCTGYPIDNEPEYVNDFSSNNECDWPGPWDVRHSFDFSFIPPPFLD